MKKILCFFGLHDWCYSVTTWTEDFMKSGVIAGGIHSRNCKRCKKAQTKQATRPNMSFIPRPYKWVDTNKIKPTPPTINT
jgi:hypothetical protein